MRDLIQDKEINDSYGLITSRDMIAEYINRAIAAEAALAAKTDECERLNLVLNERIADINAVLDDNESHRAMKLATDLAFMEQRKQIEQCRQALNRVLGFVVDCPSHQGLTDGVRPCAEEYEAGQCSKCWKIALGVAEND